MQISELIGLALAEAEEGRVETILQPGEVTASAVAALTQLVSELARCLFVVSTPGAVLRITGSLQESTYLLSMTPHGAGISTDATGLLNRLLEDQDLALRLTTLARLAGRLGVEIEFLPAAAGSAARIGLPDHLVTRRDLSVPEPTLIDLTAADSGPYAEPEPDPVETPVPSEWAWKTSETFLAEVFGSLRPIADPDPAPNNVTHLRVRVPGASYPIDADESPSTTAAEGAVDLKTALSTYDQGRRSALRRDAG